MAHPEHPIFGGRFELTRQKVREQQAHYRVRLLFANALFEYNGIFSEGGVELTLEKTDPDGLQEPPSWAQKHLNFLCNQALKTFKKEGVWTRRIRQWKEPVEKRS